VRKCHLGEAEIGTPRRRGAAELRAGSPQCDDAPALSSCQIGFTPRAPALAQGRRRRCASRRCPRSRCRRSLDSAFPPTQVRSTTPRARSVPTHQAVCWGSRRIDRVEVAAGREDVGHAARWGAAGAGWHIPAVQRSEDVDDLLVSAAQGRQQTATNKERDPASREPFGVACSRQVSARRRRCRPLEVAPSRWRSNPRQSDCPPRWHRRLPDGHLGSSSGLMPVNLLVIRHRAPWTGADIEPVRCADTVAQAWDRAVAHLTSNHDRIDQRIAGRGLPRTWSPSRIGAIPSSCMYEWMSSTTCAKSSPKLGHKSGSSISVRPVSSGARAAASRSLLRDSPRPSRARICSWSIGRRPGSSVLAGSIRSPAVRADQGRRTSRRRHRRGRWSTITACARRWLPHPRRIIDDDG